MDKCSLCNGSGEVLETKTRIMGYTLTEGETIDEVLVPCPACENKMAEDWEKTVMTEAQASKAVDNFEFEDWLEDKVWKIIAKAQAKATWEARDGEIEAALQQGYVKGFSAAESTVVPRATEDGRIQGRAEERERIIVVLASGNQICRSCKTDGQCQLCLKSLLEGRG